ncbi:hypothetical protein B7486_76490, partial [cyanobacterium TDX16]
NDRRRGRRLFPPGATEILFGRIGAPHDSSIAVPWLVGRHLPCNFARMGEKQMKLGRLFASGAVAAYLFAGAASAQTPAESAPDQLAFRELFRELIETRSSLSGGECTLAAERMAAHLWAAGYSRDDARVLVPESHPNEGALVAVLRGSDPSAPALLLLVHIDVVEARREDWERDPFVLVEEG